MARFPSTTVVYALGLLLAQFGNVFVKAQCSSDLLVDDFSRFGSNLNSLDFWTSDDGTMASISAASNKLSFTPSTNSYFYTTFDCINAPTRGFGALKFDLKGPVGSSFTLEIQSSSEGCASSAYQSTFHTVTGVTGSTETITVPLSAFPGANAGALKAIVWSVFSGNGGWELSNIRFGCASPSEPSATSFTNPATRTVPITTAAPTSFVIDLFTNPNTNALGFYHGGDDGLGMTYSGGKLTLRSTDVDYSWYTTLSESCIDFTAYEDGYLHIEYSGSNEFTIGLQQHNIACSPEIAPFPETWDVVEARRYATATDIYVPISHFKINKSRTIGFALKSFYSQSGTPTIISKIEILNTVSGVSIPEKIPAAPLFFSCTRPNSFAFAIDDGIPRLAQEVLNIIREEGIKVTFFTVGQPLLDPSTNLTNVYTEMLNEGHQIAFHSFTHPKMEGLPTTADIDRELTKSVDALTQAFGITSKYFRPPYGNEGARMRQRLEALIPGAKVINWSVDVEDWLWAETNTPEKQLTAFERDVNKGGNLAVLHYLYPSTVSYLRQFIRTAKATGKQLMRVDQCMEDPDAPPL